MEKGLRTSLIFVIVFALAIGLVSAVEIGEDLHLNLQSTFSNGTIQSGTFEFYFNISTAENCGTVVYTNSTNLTTDTRGIISHYLPDVSLDYDQQYWLCYYKDGSLESSSKIARTPYSFGALNVSAEGVKNDSDLDLTNYNVTASWFRGIFDWIIGATSGNYLSFNGTQLDFDESALNTTIDARSGIFNDSINNYIAENNVSMNNWITANNGSVVNYISGVNTSNNNYIIDYVSVQNGSMTNYIATVNTSMGNYVVDYVGTQNASLVNYIGVVNTTRDNYVADSYVPYSGADKNVDLGANNFSVDNTLLFVDANNNLVGIGTTSPEALMHLQAASGWTELRLQGGDETSGGQIRFDNSTGMEIAEIYATPNDDSFRIQTGNSDRFTIDSSGNIGIGTTTPQNLLNVDGDLNATGIFYGNGSGLHSLSSSAIEDIWVNVSGDTMTGNLDLGDNNITNVDYLGIGTTTPLADLHINRSSGWAEARLQGGDETSGGTLSLYNNTGMELAEIYATPLDDSLRFQTGGSDRFTIDSAGQVGIGTSSPAEELDVRGAVQAQQIIANGTGTHPTGIGSYIELYMLGDVARILPYDGSSYKDLAIGDYGGGNPNIMLKVGGNVGIATGTPQNTFNVAGDGNFTGDLFVNEINISANNASLVNYIAVVNTSMNNYVDYQDLTYNTSVVNHINLNNASMGNYVVDYVGIQNTSLVNYISTVNTSNNNYIVDYVGIQNTSLVNYIGTVNTTRNNYVQDTFVPYTGADQNTDLGDNNLTVNSTFYVNTNNGGRIGIGTATPQNLLNVDGDANITGTLYVNGINLSADNGSLVNYIAVVNTSMKNYVDYQDLTYNTSVVNHINLNNASNNNYVVDYVGIQNTSMQNYVGVQNTSLVNYISTVNTTRNNYLTSAYVPYTGANANLVLGANNLTVDTSVLHVDTDNDRVGIGTVSPSQLLQLQSGAGGHTFLSNSTGGVTTELVSSASSANIILDKGISGADAKVQFKTDGSLNFEIGVDSTPADIFKIGRTNNNADFVIDTSGNVGIGTTAPVNALEVAGTINATAIYMGTNNVSNINYVDIQNTSLVNYIGVVNTSNNNYIVDYVGIQNTSLVNYIGVVNTSNNNYIVDYVGIQNTSLVNYISIVNTSNNNYIVDYVGIQNTSLVNYIAANNASMGSTFVPYTGANQNINLGNNNFSVNSTFYVNTNNGGRVGVGTSAPTRNFHILTDGDTTGLDTQIYIQQSGSRDAAIQLKVASTDWTFGADNSDGDSFKIANGINLANSPALTIDTSERVGIGTTSPGSLLTVAQVATTNEINLSNTLFVNSTAGNVGIGTSAPEQLLHLVGSTNPKLYIEDSTNNVQIVAGATNTLGILGTQSAHPLSIRTGNAEAMYIDTSGQVGIGTAVPATKVEIYDSADSRLRLRSDVNENTTIDFMESTGDGDRDGFRAYYQGFDNVFNLFGVVNDVETSGISILRDSGNVGMGTTSPSFKLDVDGNFALNKTATNRLILPLNNDAATPTISFGDGDSGFYEVSDDLIGISIGGGRKWNIDSDELEGDTFGSSPRLFQGDVSSTVPQFSFNSDINTGFARAAADKISLITGGIAALFIDDSQKVGIGTITPQTELDVVGDINVTGTVNVGNTGSMRIDENGDMIFRI